MLAQKALNDASVTAQATFEPSDRLIENTLRSNRQRNSSIPQQRESNLSSIRIEQATVDLKKKNQLLEYMERDMKDRYKKNLIKYESLKQLEAKPMTPDVSEPV